ncbi:MAG: VWA domain-containing protein, partial [SAR324 cluster bacterium]|nr:VWA domain-containing protein [SAR324 cluster bacterium]
MQYFLHPSRLALLVLIIPLVWLVIVLQRNRIAAFEKLSTRFDAPKSIQCFWAFVLSVIFMIIALARPYNGMHETNIILPGRDIIFLVDISQSMRAIDMTPNRIEVAKRKILDSLATSKRLGRLDRIGIILFSGRPFVFCPLTSDYSVLPSFIHSISTDLSTSMGSNIGKAIEFGIGIAKRVGNKSVDLVLLSDGEDSTLQTKDIIEQLKKAGLRLHSIGIGSKEGVPIPLDDGNFAKDFSGNTVYSKLGSQQLSMLSKSTGGIYIEAQLDDLDLQNTLYSYASVLSEYPSRLRVYNELGPIFCVLALLAAILFLRKSPSLFLFLLLLSTGFNLDSSEAQEAKPRSSLREGYIAYNAGNYVQALEVFRYFARVYPDDRRIQQAFAASLFKTNKFREALILYSRLSENSKSGKEKFEVLYNMGNTLFALNEFKDAIEAYNRALQIKENDEHCRFNKDLAQLYLDARTQNNPPQ